MKIICLVPIKNNSQRIPFKNFRNFNGKPLYYWILTTLLKISEISQIVIDTDSEFLQKELPTLFSTERIILYQRPKELQGDSVATNDLFINVIEQLQLEAELAINQERLRSISGLAVGPLNKLATDVQIPPLSETQDYYVLKAQESNHLVQAQKYALRAAEEGISERRGAYMPEISLIAQRQDADVGFDNLPMNRRDNTYVGLNFSIPIYAGGSNRAGVSEAYSRRNIAESQLRVSQLEARELVRSAYLQIQASDAQTEAAKVLVESTILAAEAMEQGFSLGTVTSVDLLNALRDRFQAERELQRIRYDHIRYLLLLKRETGTLSAEDLVEIGEWLVQPDIE